jgi:DNA-binding MarR family transcriptional regulator
MQKELSPTFDRTVCNCLALRQAARHISQIYDSYLASEGLRTTQYSILAKLNRLGPLSINELAKAMVMDRTTLGRAIRPLERDKLLAIGEGADGRTRSLRLTPAGEARRG